MSISLNTDHNGNIILHPVTGWTTGVAAGISVILAIEYAETPSALERGERSQLQVVLTPSQSLELAEKLNTLAQKILNGQLPPRTAVQ